MTYEVQQTRWDRLIRRVSGSIGPGSRVSETLSELFPVLDVERVPGELLLLGGTHICFGGGSILALAGNRPSALLFNPVDSGVIATVSSVFVSPNPSSEILWGLTLVEQGAAVGTETFRDLRQLPTQRPSCKVFTREEVAAAGGTARVRVANFDTLHLQDENGVMVLGPGTGLDLGLNTLASQLFFCFYWRERPAVESELQF